MKLRISNLGVINTMEIDMAKPFILFAGDNGTGKTYAATFLYTLVLKLRGLLLNESNKLDSVALPIHEKFENAVDGEIKADELYDFLVVFLKKHQKEIVDSMNLNINTDSFKCEVATSKEEWKEELWEKSISVLANHIVKKSHSFEYKLWWHKEEQIPVMQPLLITSLYFDGIVGAQMFTAERSGIYTFNKELSVGRLRNPEERLNARYPKPIADGLADAADVVNQRKKESDYLEFADEIEKMLLRGNLTVSEDGEILYHVSDNTDLGYNESSSAVKTLAPLVFYLRHTAGQYNVLFVDEPELNLHPKNQILLAKIFVKMINAGLRLVISTHSDYIIREINNMIMADGLNKAGDGILAKMGYDESICLSQDKFAPYLFQKNTKGKVKVEPLTVDRYGFNMPSIDDAINQQNDVTNTFYEVLKYDHPTK